MKAPVAVKCVQLVDPGPEDRQSIDQVLAGSSNATVFHTPEWNSLLASELGLQNVALLATIGETPVGLYSFCPIGGQRWQSAVVGRQSVYGGPITTCEGPRVVAALLRYAERIKRLALFQIWSPPNYDISAFVGAGYSHRLLYTSIVNLQASEEELWHRLHKDKRTKIRKAKRNGLMVLDGGIEQLQNYRAMVENTLAPAEITPLPASFYASLLQRFVPLGMARLLLVRYGEEIVSGAVVLYYKDTAYAWDIGWRREYSGLSPNDLLTWEIIQSAGCAGYKYFDLLRVESDRLPGIATWKTTFGGETVLCYSLQKATLGYRIWRTLTFPVSPKRVAYRLQRLTTSRKYEH